MTISNKVITQNGEAVQGQGGAVRALALTTAPNGIAFSATITIQATTEGGIANAIVNLPAGDYSAYPQIGVVWHATDDDGLGVCALKMFAPVAGDNIITGTEADVYGRCAGLEVTHYELCPVDSSDRMGYSDGIHSIIPEEVQALDVTVNPVLTPPTEFATLEVTSPEYTAAEGVTFSWVYQTATDESGTSGATIDDTGGICPEITGGKDAIRVGALFTGPGTSGLEGPYYSDWETITEADPGETEVELDDDWLIASNRLAIDGVTNSTFTAGATLTQTGGKSATIVHYEAGTGELFLGPITGGAFTDNVAVSASSGGAAVANGASATWGFAGGKPFYVIEPTFTGTPTSNELIEQIRDNADDVTLTTVDLNGQFPPHFGSKQWRGTKRVSGFGIPTFQDFSSAWVDIGIPTLSPLAASAWSLEVAAEPGGGDRVVAVLIRDDLNFTAARWTTSTQAQIDANPFPAGHESMVLGLTTIVGGVTYRRCTLPNVIRESDGKNFVVFIDPADAERRTRFGVVVEIGGAWTPIGERKVVPITGSPPATASDFTRWAFRSQLQAEQGEPGGCGMQFPRGVDCDGDYVFQSYDVTYPSESDNFGDDWRSDDLNGLYMHQSTNGVCVDGDRVHMIASSIYTGNAIDDYTNAEGIYKKSRSGNTWTRTLALTNVYGSTNGPYRVNLRHICKVAGSGSGPADRTLYAIHAPAAYNSGSGGFSTIQVYRSTNGGDSWSPFGASLSVATHGVPFGIWADDTAIYINTSTRVIRRSVSTDSWTNSTGLGAGNKLHLVKRGTKVYAMAEGTGLYSANDAGTLAFSLVKSFNIKYFDVAPTDTNYITLIGNSNVVPIGTKTANGAANWYNIVTQPYAGQYNTFAHKLHGPPAWCRYHETDKTRLVGFAFQHPCKSTDGGATFFWSGRGCDYSRVWCFGFHPTDYRRMIASMTDRLVIVFDHGMGFALDDSINSTDKDAIDAATGQNPPAHKSSAGIVLVNNGHTRYVAQVGGGGNYVKTPVVFGRSTSYTAGGTGNGTLTVTASKELPGGVYTGTCTSAATNGGTFTWVGPLGEALGTSVVSVQKTLTSARGGTLTVTVNDGSTDFAAGANAKVFEVFVNPLATETILNPATKSISHFGQTNPSDASKGISGRHRFSVNSSGDVSLDGTCSHEFRGYMGTGGAILGISGTSTLMRSATENGTMTSWATNTGNFSPFGLPTPVGSHHDANRAWLGTTQGLVRKVQGGTVSTVFSYAAWLNDNDISGGWPGYATVSGKKVPPCTGVAESWFDPNLLYACFYMFGYAANFFRCKNALAATPVWENITASDAPFAPATISGKGLRGPFTACTIHPLTDEVILFSQHGTTVFRPEQAHRTTYGITVSIADHLRTMPGGAYYDTAKL